MGDSSACLVRSLSQPSPTSQDSKEGDPIRCALTSSISFGRFMTEPLVSEKWSAFTQDRHLEDAKKHSRPGSVAEKKAYFEAHFKRILAKKATFSNISESNEMDEIDEEHPIEKQPEGSHVATAGDQGEKHATATFATGNGSLEKREAASVYIEETTGGLEEADFLEKHIESSFHFKDVQGISVCQEVMAPVEEPLTVGVSASLDKNIPRLPPLQSTAHSKGVVSASLDKKIPRPPPLKSTALTIGVSTSLDKKIRRPSPSKSTTHTIGVSTSLDKKIPRPSPSKSTAHIIGVSTSLDKKIPRPSPSKPTTHTIGVSTSLDKKIPRPSPSKSTTHTIGVSTSLDKKIPRPTPSKPTAHTQASTIKPAIKRGTPICSKIADRAMAYSRKITEVWDNSRSTPKSLHMSINFSSHSTDVKKASSPLLHKIANSKFVTNLKTAKESTSQHTLTKASMNSFAKHLSAAPQPDNRRTKSPLRQSVAAEMVTGERKPKTSLMPSQSSTTHLMKECSSAVCSPFSLVSEERAAKRKEFFQKLKEKKEAEEAENRSQSSTAHIIKEHSAVVCPPFSLKSEERAAKRKEFFEKLKEKREAEEAEKEKLQGKLKGKTRNDVKDRLPLTSQANTNRSIDLASNSTKVPVKKISTSQPCSPMISKNQSTELCHNSRPSSRNALKMDSIKDGLRKNYLPAKELPPAYYSKLLPKKSTRENAPPNIQHLV